MIKDDSSPCKDVVGVSGTAGIKPDTVFFKVNILVLARLFTVDADDSAFSNNNFFISSRFSVTSFIDSLIPPNCGFGSFCLNVGNAIYIFSYNPATCTVLLSVPVLVVVVVKSVLPVTLVVFVFSSTLSLLTPSK